MCGCCRIREKYVIIPSLLVSDFSLLVLKNQGSEERGQRFLGFKERLTLLLPRSFVS